MKKVTFKGPPTNLSRFGPIEAGAELVLTDQEWACVTDDPRFEPVADVALEDLSHDDGVDMLKEQLFQMSEKEMDERIAALVKAGKIELWNHKQADRHAKVQAIMEAMTPVAPSARKPKRR